MFDSKLLEHVSTIGILEFVWNTYRIASTEAIWVGIDIRAKLQTF